MLTRLWRGWTTTANAGAYQALLVEEIIPGIQARRLDGFLGMDLLRRDLPLEVEFVTVMRFASLQAVEAFAGKSYETAVVPPRARALLTRFDALSHHYETIDLLNGPGTPPAHPRVVR